MRSPEITGSFRSAGPALASPITRGIDARPSGYSLNRFSSPNFTPLRPSPIVNQAPVSRDSLRGFSRIEAPKPSPQPRARIYSEALLRGRNFKVENFRSIRPSEIRLGTPEPYNPRVKMLRITQSKPVIASEKDPVDLSTKQSNSGSFPKLDSGQARMTKSSLKAEYFIHFKPQSQLNIQPRGLDRVSDQLRQSFLALKARRSSRVQILPQPELQLAQNTQVKPETITQKQNPLNEYLELKTQLISRLEPRVTEHFKRKKIRSQEKNSNVEDRRFFITFDEDTSYNRGQDALLLVNRLKTFDPQSGERVDMRLLATLTDSSDKTKSSMLRGQQKEDGSRLSFKRMLLVGDLTPQEAREKIIAVNLAFRPGKWGEGERLTEDEVKIIRKEGASLGEEYLIHEEIQKHPYSQKLESVISQNQVYIKAEEENIKETEEEADEAPYFTTNSDYKAFLELEDTQKFKDPQLLLV